MRRRTVLTLGAAYALAPLAGCTRTRLASIDGATMGTHFRVRLPADNNLPGLSQRITQTLRHIESTMSAYQPNSELTRMNRGDIGWIRLSEATRDVVHQALHVARATRGAFDPTVAPLVSLWGFGPEGRRQAPPARREIEALRSQVGYKRIELDQSRLRKAHRDTGIDLNGIAKGYAVDAITALLREAGVDDYLVDIGGELRARGRRDAREPWRVGVLNPATQALIPLRLSDQAIATSGNYFNYFVAGGQRYSHNIDPRTGQPVMHNTMSATVVADDTSLADAWSTALMTLGRAGGYPLAARNGVAALFLEEAAGGGVTRTVTPALERLGALAA